MIEVTDKPIDALEFQGRLSREGAGSVVIHYGVVKGAVEGRSTTGIHFSASGDLEGELRRLEIGIRAKWKIEDFALMRRLGELRVGDMILAVGVSAEGRVDAFGACRDAVEGCKKMKNISKKELFTE